MKVLFIGDVVGEAGRDMVKTYLPKLKAKHNLDVVIVNVENMAGGFGITPQTVQEMYQAGAHLLSGGNHSFDKKEGVEVLNEDDFIVRPANYPKGSPGRGMAVYSKSADEKLVLINMMGRVFMDPLDCPFQKIEELLPEAHKISPVVFVDFHAEATSEKMAYAWNLDGRVSAVVGTHTHVQTADERILPNGTAFLSDAGMTGPYDSVIGMKKDGIIEKFITRRGKKFEVASNDPWLCGVIIDIDAKTGKAQSIERVRIIGKDASTHP